MHVCSPGQGIHPSRGRPRFGQVRHTCSRAGGDGRPPRFLGNPCESVPRARDSGGSQRPRLNGRPDAVFRQANGVDVRNGKRFRSCTLAALFLAAYASPPPVARREARLATGLPLRLSPGWTFTRLDSIERFQSAHVDFLLSPGLAWRDSLDFHRGRGRTEAGDGRVR